MSNLIVAAGASSSLLPAHRRNVVSRLPATSSSFVSKSRSLHRRTDPPRREELFSRGRHRPPPLYSMTMIPSCLAKRSMGGENASVQKKEREARIKKQLLEPKLSTSPYDTAWVAMVPSRGFPQAPCFPQCVEWILLHQHDNGSWGIDEFHLSTNKCTLLSTLACAIALKKWNIGAENVKRGLDFIGRNFSIAMAEHTDAPIGFSITFPGMISLAIEMGLEFPVRKADVDGILNIRRMELKRLDGDKSYGREAYMAYVAEGLGNLLDWNDAMKFQRKNGSFFNSPSTTSAALIYFYDEKALQYLNLLVNKFGGSVPAVFPTNVHSQLSMVDSLEKIGISRHFSSEIKNILDMTYIFWLQRDEEILLDVATCAMAFRILRMNGYDVSSDELSHVAEASDFHNSLQGYISDTKSLLELYKASRVSVSKNEPVLDNIGYWSSNLLMAKLCCDGVHIVSILGEVDYALKFPFYATLDRIEHRRNIEHFDDSGYQMLKTSNLSCPLNKDHLDLAIEDFTYSQFIYQDELMHLENWVKENMLDQLEFARQKQVYAYLSACATIFPPELSNARISWAKNCVLTTITDDFFDVAGSKEELENLVALVEKWDEHHELQFYSERVKIIFRAIYTTTNQIAELALAVQNRDVRSHLTEIWIDTVRCMSTEAEWVRSQYVPTFDEYITYANTSFALGPVLLPALYFVGQEVLESVVKDEEYNELLRLVNTCGRLLNDVQGFEREGSQGKLNSVPLLVLYSGGSMSSETAIKVIHESIASHRRDLLRLVLREDSVVPRQCKELFWKMCKTTHVFYSKTDGYSSPKEMVGAVNAIIHEPLKHQNTDQSLAVK